MLLRRSMIVAKQCATRPFRPLLHLQWFRFQSEAVSAVPSTGVMSFTVLDEIVPENKPLHAELIAAQGIQGGEVSTSTMSCPRCSASVPKTTCCTNCGSTMRCPKCSTLVTRAGSKFCSNCGKKIACDKKKKPSTSSSAPKEAPEKKSKKPKPEGEPRGWISAALRTPPGDWTEQVRCIQCAVPCSVLFSKKKKRVYWACVTCPSRTGASFIGWASPDDKVPQETTLICGTCNAAQKAIDKNGFTIWCCDDSCKGDPRAQVTNKQGFVVPPKETPRIESLPLPAQGKPVVCPLCCKQCDLGYSKKRCRLYWFCQNHTEKKMAFKMNFLGWAAAPDYTERSTHLSQLYCSMCNTEAIVAVDANGVSYWKSENGRTRTGKTCVKCRGLLAWADVNCPPPSSEPPKLGLPVPTRVLDPTSGEHISDKADEVLLPPVPPIPSGTPIVCGDCKNRCTLAYNGTGKGHRLSWKCERCKDFDGHDAIVTGWALPKEVESSETEQLPEPQIFCRMCNRKCQTEVVQDGPHKGKLQWVCPGGDVRGLKRCTRRFLAWGQL